MSQELVENPFDAVERAGSFPAKKFEGFKDRQQFQVDPDWERRLIAAYSGSGRSYANVISGVVHLDQLRHRVKNGYRDALSVAIVLGAVLQSRPDGYIRAGELRLWLQEHYPQFAWDSVTVGRILGEMAEAGEIGYGTLERSPIGVGEDYKSMYYVVRGHEGRGYVAKLFESMLGIARKIVASEADGEFEVGLRQPWDDIDYSAFHLAVSEDEVSE